MSGYLYLSGGSGDHVSVPSTVALNLVATSFTIDVDVRLASSRPAAFVPLQTKDDTVGNGRGWGFYLATDGTLYFETFAEDGTYLGTLTSGVSTAVTDSRYTYRIVYDETNYVFYEKAYGASFSLLGTVAKGTAILANTDCPTDVLTFARSTTVSEGNLHAVTIWTDATQTTELYAADLTKLTLAEAAAGSFTEDSTNAATVTINGSGWRYVRPYMSHPIRQTGRYKERTLHTMRTR